MFTLLFVDLLYDLLQCVILTVVLSLVDDLGVEKIACVADPICLRQSFCKICVLLDVCVNQSRIGTESLYWPPLTR